MVFPECTNSERLYLLKSQSFPDKLNRLCSIFPLDVMREDEKLGICFTSMDRLEGPHCKNGMLKKSLKNGKSVLIWRIEWRLNNIKY